MTDTWKAPFDPDEKKDYWHDWSELLSQDNDSISTSAWTIEAQATTDGLLTPTDGIVGMQTFVWFDVAVPATSRAALVARGKYFIQNLIVTAAGREYERTAWLRIVEH